MRYAPFFVPLLAGFITFSPLAASDVNAAPETDRALLLRQIEILRREVEILQALVVNLHSAKAAAPAYIAVNLSDNSVLTAKNSTRQHPIASVTKLINAVIVTEHVSPQDTITLRNEMLEPFGYSPSLYAGLTVSAEDLLKASLIQSTNDAAESLAYFVGKEQFFALMNQKAQELDMTDTIFYDVHGLNPATISTASDLAKLVQYVHTNHPEILAITKNNDFWLPDSSGALLKFRNGNNFYPLAYFVGGKTGYLPEAKQTFAGVFEINGDPVAIIVLSSNNRRADVFGLINQLR